MPTLKRLLALTSVLFVVGCGTSQAQEAPKDGGPIYVGRYAPIDTRSHVKLWLARYTNPALLAMADVAFATPLPEFCSAKDRPEASAFYTEAFALARPHDGGYDVDKLMQLRKIDACKAPRYDGFVLSKTPLPDVPHKIVINWAAEEAVGGISANDPPPVPGAPYRFNSSGVPTALVRDQDAKLLLAYAPDLDRRGIEVMVGMSSWFTDMPPTRVLAASVPSRPTVVPDPPLTAAASVPRAPSVAPPPRKKFCLRNADASAPNRAETCSDDIGELAAKIAAMPVTETPAARSVRKPSAMRVRPASVGQDKPPSAELGRYVLEIN